MEATAAATAAAAAAAAAAAPAAAAAQGATAAAAAATDPKGPATPPRPPAAPGSPAAGEGKAAAGNASKADAELPRRQSDDEELQEAVVNKDDALEDAIAALTPEQQAKVRTAVDVTFSRRFVDSDSRERARDRERSPRNTRVAENEL